MLDDPDSGLRICLLIFEPSKGRSPFLPGLVGSVLGAPCAGSGVVLTGPSLVCSRIFDEVMGCFCDSPPQSPTFPEAGHASLYDEDKVGWVFSGRHSRAGSRAEAGCPSLAGVLEAGAGSFVCLRL